MDAGCSLASKELTYMAAGAPAAPLVPPGAHPGQKDVASVLRGETQPTAGRELPLVPVLLVSATSEL